MFTLATGESLRAVAGSASAITYTLTGDEKAGSTDGFKVLAQGQIPAVAAAIYTVPGATATLVQRLFLANVTAGTVTLSLYINGVAGTNLIASFSITANGFAIFAHDGWHTYDSTGKELISSSGGGATVAWTTITGNSGSATADTSADILSVVGSGVVNVVASDNPEVLTITSAALTGDVTTVGAAATLATVNANVGSWGTASSVPQFTINAKGLMTAAGNVSIAITAGQVSGLNAMATNNLTGDVTSVGAATTLATVNANVGSFGSASTSLNVTANAKGLLTAVSTNAIQITEAQVTNLVTDLSGKQPTGNYITAITGDLAAAGPGSAAGTLATVNANVGAFGSASSVGTFTVNAKGLTTAAASTAIQITEAQVTNLVTDLAGKALSSRLINTTAPLTGGGDLTADRTIAAANATTSTAGWMSALDKKKLDNLWIDVTANSIALVLPANTAAANITAINAILSGAPNGSTIFFPHGIYLFNAAWTYPAATAKMFAFKGEGDNRAGSPATTYTELQWTANVGGDIITLPGSGNGWYTSFDSMTFTSSATQSAGALININGNVGTNFTDCAFQSVGTGQTFFDVLNGSGGSSNSWNSAVIDNCSFQGFTNTAIRVNSSGSSLVISNCVIQGQWGSTTQIAAACVSGGWVGALQLIGCDILGAVNNLLLNPVLASSEVCASVQCTNTYFDFALGSCIKVTGTGATVRCKWDTCTFTTSNAGTGFSAVEIAGSNVYAAGGQDLAFVNCNIYNTFGTTGTTNGVLITNAADVSFTNCKVAGWTNGYNVTPMASNKTNLQITVGTIGPSGGFGGNSVGLLIGAGAYKGLQVRGCNVIGNTTNLTLGAVTVIAAEGALFALTENAGINPRGSVGVVAVPGSGVAATNTTGFRVLVMQRFTVVPTGWAINGVACVLPIATSVFTFTLEPGGTITTTGGTYTWTWVGQ